MWQVLAMYLPMSISLTSTTTQWRRYRLYPHFSRPGNWGSKGRLLVVGLALKPQHASQPHWTQLQVMLTAPHPLPLPHAHLFQVSLIVHCFYSFIQLIRDCFQLFDRNARLSHLVFSEWFHHWGFWAEDWCYPGDRKEDVLQALGAGHIWARWEIPGWQNNTPPNVHIPISGTCEYHPTWQRGFANVIHVKDLNYRREYPGASRWAQSNHMNPWKKTEGWLQKNE